MKLTGNIFMLLLSSVLLLLPTGCVREDFPVHCAEQGKEVTLQISISQSPLTKAPTGSVLNDYEKDIKELRIYAFYNGAFAGHQYIDDVSAYKTQDGTLKFYMDLTMFVIGEQKVDFYVIANESSMLSPSQTLGKTTTEAQLKGMYFSSLEGIHLGDFPLGFVNVAQQSYVLKMEDVHKVNNAAGHEKHSIVETVYAVDADGNAIKDNPLSTISFDLKRPLGKLCIFAAKAPGTTGDLTVCGIRMLENGTRRNNYLMRQSPDVLKKMTTKLIGGLALHISDGSETGGSKLIEKTLTTSGSTTESHYDCVLLHDYYPHENAYGASPDTWNEMKYYEPDYGSDGDIESWTLAEEQAQTEADYKGNILEMDYYFGSDPSAVKTQKIYLPPIERNRYYGIYCSIKNAGGISIVLNVSNWDPIQENWTFEYNYPDYVDLYPVEIDNTDPKNPAYIYPAQPTLYYSTDRSGDFKARFKIWGPENCEWNPVLDVKNVTVNGVTTNASNDHYEYEVFEVVDGTPTLRGKSSDNKTYTNSNNEYEIHVKALSTENLNAIIKLGVSFVPKWDEGNHMLLLINGAAVNQCRWPNSGTLPEWIEIKQVEIQPGTGGGGTTGGGTT